MPDRLIQTALCFLFALTGVLCVAKASENPGVPWPATDALGRKLPMESQVGPSRSDRFVGIFYFINHLGAPRSPQLKGPYDVSKILALDPGAATNANCPLWGGNGVPHYWGEPLFGYYRSDDPWILRRHAQLLADAGVDVIIFDTTNARTYPQSYRSLCEIFAEVRKAGGRTPQIAFMVHTRAHATAEKIFHDLYLKNFHPELWFRWHGKPLMICDPVKATPDLKRFFTLRAAHWPFTMTNTPYAWYWEADYPQPYGFTDNPQKPEEINVSVAQNLSASTGKVVNMNSGDARGRSFHDGKQNIAPGSVNWGYNFREQWKRAFQLQPPFVMVTGWNEWTAGRWIRPGNPLVFVDQYDEEFSRDIEPMKGGFADDYYWQLVANIRRYKGVPALPKCSPPKTIVIRGSFKQWRNVRPDYRDYYTGDTLPRNYAGTGGLHYTNYSGRNDLTAFKVARDTTNLYFYVRTVRPISPPTDPNWMWLLIDSDQNPATGWAGYDFIVNRNRDAEGRFWLEKNMGGWTWKKVVPVQWRVNGNQLQLAVPRAALGLSDGNTGTDIDFKWADNLQHPGEVMDFYLSGDVAPAGRFNYRYDAN